MNEFNEIQELLNEIMDDSKPLPTLKPHKQQPLSASALQAITEVAANTFDPELLEIAGREGALSLAQAEKAAKAVTRAASKKFEQRCKDPASIDSSEFEKLHTALDVSDEIRQKYMPVAQAPASDLPSLFDELSAEQDVRIPIPTFTSDELMKTMNVRNFATLVTLNMSRWHATIKDRQASRDAAAVNEAHETAFETRKRLLAGADASLKSIYKVMDAARTKHYEMSVPWSTRGVNAQGHRTGARLLPNTLFFEYTSAMAQFKEQMKQALDDFVPQYPSLIQAAQKRLGKRFDAEEYPPAEKIRQYFDLSFDFQPIPQGEDFKGLPQQQLDALASSINRKGQQMVENAMQEVWVRLYKAMTHMHERLATPDKSFHASLTDNVRELSRLLQHLNITSNNDISRIKMYLEKFVCKHEADDLRKNGVLRQEVAAHVKNVIDKMDKIGRAPT